ncbi:MAG: tetratricopeptide repeat protein [Bacteroidota bacterium]
MANQLAYVIHKAGITACFFLLSFSSFSGDKIWVFDPDLQKAYQLILNLQTDQAYSELKKINSKSNELHKLYVLSLCETVDVLITEDAGKFEKIDANFKERLRFIQSLPVSAETLFLEAELNLQRGFNLINLNQELSAVFAIKAAYNAAQECQKNYPDFIPIKKTSGVIQVMVGSVPDKFHWFMSLLGMKGSVKVGQKQLEELKASNSSLHLEATILFFTIKGFINQQFEEASKGIADCLKSQPDNRLLLFLGVNMMMKNSQSEEALTLIHALDNLTSGLPVYYMEYLRGEILLQKGDYTHAIHAYQKFIQGYKSHSFKKDAYYKISLCYVLQNKHDLARTNFDLAKKMGKEVAEPDKAAAAQLREDKFPNTKILKVRFYTDGGYYKEAKEALHVILPPDLALSKDLIEYYYRKARLSHKTGELPAAKLFYNQTIDMTGENPWYFAPNSALQLGYIAQSQKDFPSAKKYFEKALSYKRHEYKNSIDGKAKSALDALEN